MIVDDDATIRRLLARMLEAGGYRAHVASGPADALDALSRERFDLVLSDVMMPDESGLGLLEYIRGHDRDTPVVMVSGMNDPTFADTALELGAYGYVTKPFDSSQVLIAAANAIRRRDVERENASYRARLEGMVNDRTAALAEALQDLQAAGDQLRHSAELTLQALAQAIEGRDIETGHHVVRVSRYTNLLALACGFDHNEAELMGLASIMHDIGKIGVPDGILFKPGAFTPAEYDVIKQHTGLGYRILAHSDQPLIKTAATIAHTHHERWDGSGYPRGLQGEAIPIEGRIAAVADVFDAVVSRRVYKPALPLDHALDILRHGRGTDFDATVIDAFFDHLDEVLDVRRDCADEEGQPAGKG